MHRAGPASFQSGFRRLIGVERVHSWDCELSHLRNNGQSCLARIDDTRAITVITWDEDMVCMGYTDLQAIEDALQPPKAPVVFLYSCKAATARPS